MADRNRNTAPTLEIKGLHVYYGSSHALQGVDLTLQHGVLSVVGRNGMGKTTLCKAIMGLAPSSGGSIRFKGQERQDVEEYSVSENWVRVALGKKMDRHGRPLTIKLTGPVEPYYLTQPETDA